MTGASSGIGREIARQLAEAGTELVVVARNEQQLRELAGSVDVECEVIVADLADRSELARVEARLADEGDPIDLLVNNAGFGYQGEFRDLDLDSESTVVDVNVTAVHRLAHVAAGEMGRRGRGGILNVSSMAGFTSAPSTATYAATKAFVTSFSESLHAELGPLGVHVCALCPGFTRTDFQRRADYDTSSIPDAVWQTAEEVAAAGLRGVEKGRPIVVPGALNKAATGAINAMPARLRRLLVARLAG